MPGQTVYTRMGKLSAIVTILPASMAAGWVLGYYLVDKLFGTFPWGAVSATLLGAGAGFYEIIQILAIDRQDSSG
jgi:F0F1-type ATP synthase assembly protein I